MVSVVPLSVWYATSMDSDHPPTNMVDNDETTFWVTTGLYPQEAVMQFKYAAQITRITLITGKVKSMAVYAATDSEMTEWIPIETINLPGQPIKQRETHQLNYQNACYGIKLVVTKGWGQFSAIYMAKVEGPAVTTK